MNPIFSSENDLSNGSRTHECVIRGDGDTYESPDCVFKVVKKYHKKQLPFIVLIGKSFDLEFEFTNTSSAQVCELKVEVGCQPQAEIDIKARSDDFCISPVPSQDFVDRRVSNKTKAVISTKLSQAPLQNGGKVSGQIGIKIRRIVGAPEFVDDIREIPGRLGLFKINLKVQIWRVNESTTHAMGTVTTEQAVIFQPLPLISRLRHITKDEILVYIGTVVVAYLLGRLMSNPKESVDAVIQWLYSFPVEMFFQW